MIALKKNKQLFIIYILIRVMFAELSKLRNAFSRFSSRACCTQYKHYSDRKSIQNLPDESDGPWKGSNFCLLAFGGPSTRWSAISKSVISAVYQAKAEALAQCYDWQNSQHCNRLFIVSEPQNTCFISKNMNKTAPNSRCTECFGVDASHKAHIN